MVFHGLELICFIQSKEAMANQQVSGRSDQPLVPARVSTVHKLFSYSVNEGCNLTWQLG